jgi:hypothetical protein
MGSARFLLPKIVFMSICAVFMGTSDSRAAAGGLCSELRLVCENGHTYPFCPIALSDEGDVVTGLLVTGGRRGHHVRLVPMGSGYRYAGHGIWFDGLESQAVLHFGKYNSVPCTVVR